MPGVILMLTIFVLQGVAFGLALLNTPLAIVGALVLPTVWTILASAFPTVAKVAVWLDLNQVTGPPRRRQDERRGLGAPGDRCRLLGRAAVGHRDLARPHPRGEVTAGR